MSERKSFFNIKPYEVAGESDRLFFFDHSKLDENGEKSSLEASVNIIPSENIEDSTAAQIFFGLVSEKTGATDVDIERIKKAFYANRGVA